MMLGKLMGRNRNFKMQIVDLSYQLIYHNRRGISTRIYNKKLVCKNQALNRKNLEFSSHHKFTTNNNNNERDEIHSDENKINIENQTENELNNENSKISIKSRSLKYIRKFNEEIFILTNGKLNLTAIGNRIKLTFNKFRNFIYTHAIIPYKETWCTCNSVFSSIIKIFFDF